MLNRRIPFFLTIAIVLVAYVAYYPFSPAGIQARNMSKARSHIPIVQRALGSEPRFANVTFDDFTAQEGSLLVGGTVPTRADLDRLKEIVASTSPPTAVIFHVFVDDEMMIPQTVPSR
jgi:hypothetical protein